MLEQKPLASAASPTVLQSNGNWNSLPSDISHIRSSHTFKTALKTHLYKQYKKWFQILSSYLPPLFTLLHPSLHSTCACVCEEYNIMII